MGELPVYLLALCIYVVLSLSGSEGKKLSKEIEFQFFLTLIFLLGFPVPPRTADSHSVEKENSKSKVIRKKEERAIRKRRGEKMDSMEEEGKEEYSLSLDGEMMSINDHESKERDEEEEEEKEEEEEEVEEEDGTQKEVEVDWDMLLARVLSQYTVSNITLKFMTLLFQERRGWIRRRNSGTKRDSVTHF